MVGRFNVREGAGDSDWSVWDNAANGSRGAGLSEQAAHRLAGDPGPQYAGSGAATPDHIRGVDPPVPVEKAWQPAGFLDAWIFEQGTWLGRVKGKDDKVSWVPQAELRRAEQF